MFFFRFERIRGGVCESDDGKKLEKCRESFFRLW